MDIRNNCSGRIISFSLFCATIACAACFVLDSKDSPIESYFAPFIIAFFLGAVFQIRREMDIMEELPEDDEYSKNKE